MDVKRRSSLRDALKMLAGVIRIVEAVSDKEQDCLDNVPENLQGTERFERMEDAVDSLNEALEKLDDAKEHIEAVIG